MMTCHMEQCYHNSSLQPEDFQTTVRLFRLNSFVKDTGRKEDAEAEPERQQWDDPMEFLMSCISMSVGNDTNVKQLIIDRNSVNKAVF